MIYIYTDGACMRNPGPGGWAALVLSGDEYQVCSGSAADTTNNRMELTAAIEALKYFTERSIINLHTDSKYVKEGIETWIVNWKKNGWKTASKKPVKNKMLWVELDNQIARHSINWQWIKGHLGHIHNEQADYLARRFIEEN